MTKLPLSKGALTTATVASYAIFLILVSYGWWTLLVRWNSPPLYVLVQALLVALIVVLASITIRAIAILRAQPETSDIPRSRLRGIGYWFVVASITAIGTVSGAFNWLESRSILRDDIAMVEGKFDTLVQRANMTLGSNRYQSERQRLIEHLKELEGEIDESTGTKCGFGSKAEIALGKINTVVAVERTSASVPLSPCNHTLARQMYAPYPERTWAAFEAKWSGTNTSERRKEVTLRRIKADRETHRTALDDLAVAAEGYGSTDALPKSALIEAKSSFNGDLKALAEFAPVVTDEIGPIDHLQSSDTESYASTFQLLLARWSNIRTWIYLLAAILIDFVLIGLLTELAARYAKGRVQAAGLSEEERMLVLKFEQDPRFLWTASPLKQS